MTNNEYEVLVEKAIQNAPEWLTKDIDEMIEKAEADIRISYVISELYNKYSFNATHLFSAMTENHEWATVSRERLNFIDNNIDLIQAMMKKR
ncbi:MAG TPA: hypothetical protein VEY51_17495 [Chondromyces sp.]|nr:hypothetical protein [Chondromyces sp.]